MTWLSPSCGGRGVPGRDPSPAEKLQALADPLRAHSLVLGRQVVEDVGDRDG